jgi:hypothetical protein
MVDASVQPTYGVVRKRAIPNCLCLGHGYLTITRARIIAYFLGTVTQLREHQLQKVTPARSAMATQQSITQQSWVENLCIRLACYSVVDAGQAPTSVVLAHLSASPTICSSSTISAPSRSSSSPSSRLLTILFAISIVATMAPAHLLVSPKHACLVYTLVTHHTQQTHRSMMLLGVARANTSVGVVPKISCYCRSPKRQKSNIELEQHCPCPTRRPISRDHVRYRIASSARVHNEGMHGKKAQRPYRCCQLNFCQPA